MTEKLGEALEKLEINYDEVVEIANGVVEPLFERANSLINWLNHNINNLTPDQLRIKMLELQLAAETLSGIREKSAIKADLASALQKEKYAISFNGAEGTTTARANTATLEVSAEIVSEIVTRLAANLIKAKVDQLQRLVDCVKNILIGRAAEAKNLNIGTTNNIPDFGDTNPF